MMRCSFWALTAMVAGVVIAASGCSDRGAATVTGMVKLDGRPLADAEVRFCGKEDASQVGNSARTRTDGTFALEPHPQTGKTLPTGPYVVLVAKMVQNNGTVPDAEDTGMLLASDALHNSLPQRYDQIDQSPFRVEITKGDNALAPFELKSH